MLKKSGIQYLIKNNDVAKIFTCMGELQQLTPIMINRLVKRVVCVRDPEEKKWIRIMEGDIEYIGDTQRCTMTYITEKRNANIVEKAGKKTKDTLILKVDNFEDAIHLAKNMDYNIISYQENLRSKYTCELYHVTYMIRFDRWAQIKDYTVVEVSLFSSGQNDFRDFVDSLNILQYAVKIESNDFHFLSEEEKTSTDIKASVDIDELYKVIHGQDASTIRYITFDSTVFDLFKKSPQKETS